MRLNELIASKVRAEVFRLLFGLGEKELHLREIQRKTKMNQETIREDLTKLVKMDLVKSRKDSNRLYYSANTDHPLYHTIRELVLKTSGLVDVLQKALNHEEVKVAFVFGSIATNTDQAGSDVDLMIIGDVDLRKVVGWVYDLQSQVGREINPHTMSIEEFKKRKNAQDHFLTSVLESPKLFVIGTDDELTGLG